MNRVQSSVQTFRDLIVWQKAHRLALDVYEATHSFPREEVYGLTSQLRRAVLSTPTNIVEGSKRNTRIGFRHFVNISQGSNEEVKYLLLVSCELGYLPKDLEVKLGSLADEVGAMLHALAAGLKLNSVH